MPPYAPVISREFVHIEETFTEAKDGTIYNLGSIMKKDWNLLVTGLNINGAECVIGTTVFVLHALGSLDGKNWTPIVTVTEANYKANIAAIATAPYTYIMLSLESVTLGGQEDMVSVRANLMGDTQGHN